MSAACGRAVRGDGDDCGQTAPLSANKVENPVALGFSYPTTRRAAMPNCSVDDCEKPVKYLSKDLCSMHGSRLARTGSTDARVRPTRDVPPSRLLPSYRVIAMAGHPLANVAGGVPVHRLVLWNRVGNGPQSCHWCGRSIKWFGWTHVDRLCADHVDGNRLNNDPTNIVPSCNRCNTGRARRPDYLTHCANGHPWTDESTRHRPAERARGCRICDRERHAKAS